MILRLLFSPVTFGVWEIHLITATWKYFFTVRNGLAAHLQNKINSHYTLSDSRQYEVNAEVLLCPFFFLSLLFFFSLPRLYNLDKFYVCFVSETILNAMIIFCKKAQCSLLFPPLSPKTEKSS